MTTPRQPIHCAKRPRLIAPSTLNDTFTDDFFADLFTPSLPHSPNLGSPSSILGSPSPLCGSPSVLLSPHDIHHLFEGLEACAYELPDIPIYKRHDRVHLTTHPKKTPFWVQSQHDAFHYTVTTTKQGTATLLVDVAEMVPVQLGV